MLVGDGVAVGGGGLGGGGGGWQSGWGGGGGGGRGYLLLDGLQVCMSFWGGRGPLERGGGEKHFGGGGGTCSWMASLHEHFRMGKGAIAGGGEGGRGGGGGHLLLDGLQQAGLHESVHRRQIHSLQALQPVFVNPPVIFVTATSAKHALACSAAAVPLWGCSALPLAYAYCQEDDVCRQLTAVVYTQWDHR